MNLKDLIDGKICPKCHKEDINTFKHKFAKRWCGDCGYVLREEGNKTPYDYLKHV